MKKLLVGIFVVLLALPVLAVEPPEEAAPSNEVPAFLRAAYEDGESAMAQQANKNTQSKKVFVIFEDKQQRQSLEKGSVKITFSDSDKSQTVNLAEPVDENLKAVLVDLTGTQENTKITFSLDGYKDTTIQASALKSSINQPSSKAYYVPLNRTMKTKEKEANAGKPVPTTNFLGVTIKGTVKNNKQTGIKGATITVKSRPNITTKTGENGEFTLKLSKQNKVTGNDTLLVRAQGYKDATQPLKDCISEACIITLTANSKSNHTATTQSQKSANNNNAGNLCIKTNGKWSRMNGCNCLDRIWDKEKGCVYLTGNITGTVYNFDNLEAKPIPGAEISIKGKRYLFSYSKADGTFTLKLSEADQIKTTDVLLVEAEGYKPFTTELSSYTAEVGGFGNINVPLSKSDGIEDDPEITEPQGSDVDNETGENLISVTFKGTGGNPITGTVTYSYLPYTPGESKEATVKNGDKIDFSKIDISQAIMFHCDRYQDFTLATDGIEAALNRKTLLIQFTPLGEVEEFTDDGQQVSDDPKVNGAVGGTGDDSASGDNNTNANEAKKAELSDKQKQEKVNELRENYQNMKDKEQSIENKLIDTAGIAGGAIGGQQIASALAEQKADKEAEQEMAAYLATFRCDFGQGANITGGKKQIELPGANELLPLYQEYKTLAADLKQRKEALDMKPGIESEVILDKAEMGLYENAAVGKTSGTYASLAKALMDKNGEDAAALQEQKEATKKKLTTGAVVAGVGLGGSLIADVAVNSGEDDKNKADEIVNKYEQKKIEPTEETPQTKPQ